MDNILGPLFAIILLILFCLWCYCMIDILTSRFKGNEKLLWAVVVILAPVLGMLLYLILGSKNKYKRRRFDPYQKDGLENSN